jgi:hypothetical protein
MTAFVPPRMLRFFQIFEKLKWDKRINVLSAQKKIFITPRDTR